MDVTIARLARIVDVIVVDAVLVKIPTDAAHGRLQLKKAKLTVEVKAQVTFTFCSYLFEVLKDNEKEATCKCGRYYYYSQRGTMKSL